MDAPLLDIKRELERNKQDSIISEIELQNEKNSLIVRMQSSLGQELKNFNPDERHVFKIKKTLSSRLKDFFNKIKYVIFGEQEDGTQTYI